MPYTRRGSGFVTIIFTGDIGYFFDGELFAGRLMPGEPNYRTGESGSGWSFYRRMDDKRELGSTCRLSMTLALMFIVSSLIASKSNFLSTRSLDMTADSFIADNLPD